MSYKDELDLDWILDVAHPLADGQISDVSRSLRRAHEREQAGDCELHLLATVCALLIRVEELEAELDEALEDAEFANEQADKACAERDYYANALVLPASRFRTLQGGACVCEIEPVRIEELFAERDDWKARAECAEAELEAGPACCRRCGDELPDVCHECVGRELDEAFADAAAKNQVDVELTKEKTVRTTTRPVPRFEEEEES